MSLIRARYRAVNTIMNLPRGGGYVGLLDLYPNAAAAYSLRKLRAAYSGSAVRVRKEVSTVSSETDIGFLADGSLDTVSLLAFASDADSGDVFVVTWYDQSLSNDATQGTAADQPKIVSGGSLVTENGKAAIDFDGVNDILKTPSITHGTDDISIIGVFMNELNTGDQSFISGEHGSGMQWSRNRNNAWSATINTGTSSYSVFNVSFTINQQYLFGSYYASDWNVYANNQNLGNSTIGVHDDIGSGIYALGALFNNTDFLQGNIQELIIYSSDQSANRAAIETNINTFYSIYP